MQLAKDEDIVPLVDRLRVLEFRFQEPPALVERSRNFGGYLSVSHSAQISRGPRLATVHFVARREGVLR
jgi:hypothetical protein